MILTPRTNIRNRNGRGREFLIYVKLKSDLYTQPSRRKTRVVINKSKSKAI